MSKMENLRDLLEHQIKDLYSAEKQIIDALPKVMENTKNEELKTIVAEHLEETKNQKRRLEKVAELLDISPDGETCKAMEGLVKETSSMIKEDASPEVMDAALIADAQKVEHYEISGYGTAITYANQLGLKEVADILKKTIDEEKTADEKLNKIAKSKINEEAGVA